MLIRFRFIINDVCLRLAGRLGCQWHFNDRTKRSYEGFGYAYRIASYRTHSHFLIIGDAETFLFACHHVPSVVAVSSRLASPLIITRTPLRNASTNVEAEEMLGFPGISFSLSPALST